MKFKIDENLPWEAVELFGDAGYEASSVLGQSMGGASDPDVASECRREQRALLTLDVDLADIRTYTPEEYHGLIVLRLKQQDKVHVVDVMRRLLPALETEPLADRLWIVEEKHIRIRG